MKPKPLSLGPLCNADFGSLFDRFISLFGRAGNSHGELQQQQLLDRAGLTPK
jgi:hypothetical protein